MQHRYVLSLQRLQLGLQQDRISADSAGTPLVPLPSCLSTVVYYSLLFASSVGYLGIVLRWRVTDRLYCGCRGRSQANDFSIPPLESDVISACLHLKRGSVDTREGV